MEKIIKRVKFSEAEDQDVIHWQLKTPQERIAALTRLRMSYHGGQRLVKVITKVVYDF